MLSVQNQLFNTVGGVQHKSQNLLSFTKVFESV